MNVADMKMWAGVSRCAWEGRDVWRSLLGDAYLSFFSAGRPELHSQQQCVAITSMAHKIRTILKRR